MKDGLIAQIFDRNFHADIDMDALWQEIGNISAAHAPEVMRLLFRRDGVHTGVTLKEAGKVVGVTKERIHQIRQKSLRILRHPKHMQRYMPSLDP